ncbi:MAG: hypothetical protein S0880_33720 [Actinomycetota bacterium]|nr:hypothetical protein [Actinomycetota bacterium]
MMGTLDRRAKLASVAGAALAAVLAGACGTLADEGASAPTVDVTTPTSATPATPVPGPTTSTTGAPTSTTAAPSTTAPDPTTTAPPADDPGVDPATGRDPWRWPFASDSIWNMPIGSGAQYTDAGIGPAGYTGIDREYFFTVAADDPVRPVYRYGSWSNRCSGTEQLGEIRIPDDLIVPDADPPTTPNNPTTLLQPDGRTVIQLNGFARCDAGGPAYGYLYDPVDLYGEGVLGAHGGSAMSAIGGSIRSGELTSDQPIRHALKVNLWAERYYHFSGDRPGYRWPALQADSYASPSSYAGDNPALVLGSLLAIPPGVEATDLGLTTEVGTKLFAAMRDYGVYVVDDSAWDAHDLSVEAAVEGEVRDAYGLDMSSDSGALHDDLNRLYSALSVVDNNGPDTIGGGGEPRAPLAPPLGG